MANIKTKKSLLARERSGSDAGPILNFKWNLLPFLRIQSYLAFWVEIGLSGRKGFIG